MVVLGANASGLDISIELAKVGAQVRKQSQTETFELTQPALFILQLPLLFVFYLPRPIFFKVILSHRKPRFTFPLPPEIKQSSPVTAVDEDGNIHFQVLMSQPVLDISAMC